MCVQCVSVNVNNAVLLHVIVGPVAGMLVNIHNTDMWYTNQGSYNAGLYNHTNKKYSLDKVTVANENSRYQYPGPEYKSLLRV